ncbi:MAG: alkaline phosphatase family protein [Terriglobales bacterium]
MVRFKATLVFGAVLLLACGLIGLNSCSSGSTGNQQPPPPTNKIKHVVIILQENRTPDNLFHDPVLINRGADIASTGPVSNGQTVPLMPVPLGISYDFGHAHASFLQGWNNGLMNAFDKDGVYCPPAQPDCAPSYAQYQYVQASDVQPYFTLAETYTFGDRMFQTNQGPSFAAHQFILSGTSAISETSNIYAAEVPLLTNGLPGCASPPDSTVQLIYTTNPNPATNETTTAYPCFDHPTMTDLLNANSISWKYYTATPGSLWTAPASVEHMCGPNVTPPNATGCTGSDWMNHVVMPETTVLTDIAAGQLASVSWVIPRGQNSDHPAYGENNGGPSWVASIVNAIGTSSYWSDTAIIIAWDDWGGWYDHVPPPSIYNSYEYGFRVPLIVVSAYAKPGYISHQNYDFGSVLKFVETTFNLGEIDPTVHYADSRAVDFYGDCFDMTQTPLTFTPIPAPLGPDYFLNDKRVPAPADDD